MTIPNLSEGDLCDITIRGVRFYAAPDPDDEPGERFWTFAVGNDEHRELLSFNLDDPQYSVEYAGPENWPPQLGDIWRDEAGDEWIAASSNHRGNQIVLSLIDGMTADLTPDEAIRDYPSLRLVRRREVA